MEDWMAERKIWAARVLKRFPELRGTFWSGKFNLSLLEIALGYAHRENWETRRPGNASRPSPENPARQRRELASRYPASMEQPRDRVRPLTAELSELRCVVQNEVLETLEDIRGLLVHSHPGISLGELLGVIAADYRTRHHPEERAMRAAKRIEKKEAVPENPRKTSKARLPRVQVETKSRILPQKLQNQLILKKGYQCAFVDKTSGQRCKTKKRARV